MNPFKDKFTHAILPLVLALLVSFILASCGGGGGESPPATPQPGANEVLISGRAAKGTILNATVRATQIINGQLNGTQKDVELGTNGDFAVVMPKGLVHLQVIPEANSTTQDEATGVAVALPPEFKFRAAADLIDTTAATVSLNITPFSEAGVALAEKSGGLTAENINKANSGIANILGFDHLSTKPIQSSDTAGLANATTNEKMLSMLNAAVSDMAATDALGCGVKASYGQVIDCTVAKLADQFEMNNAALAQPMAVGIMQTDTANSTRMATLLVKGYQSIVVGSAKVASVVTALKDTTLKLVQDGFAFGVSAATYACSISNTCADSQAQSTELDYQAVLAARYDLIKNANTNFRYAVLSNLVYDDLWVNGNSPGKKLPSLIKGSNPGEELPSPVADYVVLDWSKYGLDGLGTWNSGLQWGAFYSDSADEIVFAYRGTTSDGDWLNNIIEAVVSCPDITPQYYTARAQFSMLMMNEEFSRLHGNKEVVLTGHSLGGGIASYIAMMNSSRIFKKVGFNSAPLCGEYSNYGLDDSKIDDVFIIGDPVSSLSDPLVPSLKFYYPGGATIPYPNPYTVSWANLFDSHSMETVLFAVRAANKLCSNTPGCPEPTQTPTDSSLPLVVAGMQSSYSTGLTPYRPAIQLSGSRLSEISQISWDCTQPNGAACPGSPYIWTPSDWAGKVDIFNDTSVKVYPGLLALGDTTGIYNWTATFSARNADPVSKSFTVVYQPQASTGIVVENLGSTWFTAGTTTISTTTSPVVSALTVTGKNLVTVERIEWRWSGAASGSATWRKSDPTWNSKVTFTSDSKLILSPTVVEANPTWSGTIVWIGTLMDAAGASQNITFSVVYQPITPTQLPGSFTLSNLTPVWDTVAPAAPAVRLNWTGSSNATSYEIYRNGTKISTITGTTFYNNSGLTSGQTYSYYIVAKNSAGSTQSNTINVGPMPSAPVVAPVISSLSKNTFNGTCSDQPITIYGSNFVSGATVNLYDLTNGDSYLNKETTFNSSGQLTLSATYGGSAANWSLTVVNPNGLSSSSVNFSVVGPTITGVFPSPVPRLNSAQTITFYGTGFLSGAAVQIDDGTGPYAKTPTVLSSGQMTISAYLTSAPATWRASIRNCPNLGDTWSPWFNF